MSTRSMTPQPLRFGVAAVALALVIAGCAGSDPHAGHGAQEQLAEPVAGASEVAVTAVDIDFLPDTLQLTAGEPLNLTVTNEGEALHDFTLDASDVHLNVEPGDSRTTSLTVDEPGQYEAMCTVAGHAEAGMTIDVTVS